MLLMNNILKILKKNPLIEMQEKNDYYFVHSYYFECQNENNIIAVTNYGIDFPSIVFKEIEETLGDIDQKNIADFENKIIEKCKSEKPEILDSIKISGKLEEDSEKSLTEIIGKLKKNFNS